MSMWISYTRWSLGVAAVEAARAEERGGLVREHRADGRAVQCGVQAADLAKMAEGQINGLKETIVKL